MKKRDASRIQATEMKFLRSILGKTRRDRIRNEVIGTTVGEESLNKRIERQRLRWFGHMRKMEPHRLPRNHTDIMSTNQKDQDHKEDQE
ncbi:hypothetical protein M8J77_001701 [Diaphorina citri]|nr:hypothetical protein M8J77_001701 [Diaphorina citri]